MPNSHQHNTGESRREIIGTSNREIYSHTYTYGKQQSDRFKLRNSRNRKRADVKTAQNNSYR